MSTPQMATALLFSILSGIEDKPVKPIYPHKCCRCGFCCLSVTCEIGQMVYGVQKNQLCPGLSFDPGDLAACALIKDGIPDIIIGKGAGCCVSARAVADGKEYPFAPLPEKLKIVLARRVKEFRYANR